MAVVLYHLDLNISNINLFSGGYLGVDIFFVLSGYLITKISIEKKRTFSQNILSRLRRLLPALLLMILITIVYASIFYMPQNLIKTSYGSIFSSLFLSNLYFYKSLQIYGDDSQFSSLIHTWSLSAEMQIYLFFFISILFINKKNDLKKYVLFIFFISLIITFYFHNEKKLFSFYSPITRLVEFSAGALTFLFYIEIKKFIGNKINIFFVIAFLSILILLSYSNNPMPNIINLIVVLSSIILILNKNFKFFYKKNFLRDFFVYLGKISYSFYLFHYPVFLLIDNLILEKDYINIALKLLISISFAILSYEIVEKKFTDKNIVNNLKFTFFNLSIFLVIISLGLNAIKSKGFFDGLDPKLKKYTIQNFSQNRNLYQNNESCHNRIKNYCYFKKNNLYQNIYLYGDSHADAISKNLYNKISLKNLNYVPITVGGTFPGVILKKNNDENNIKFTQSYNASEYLKKLKNQKIIIFSRYSLYINNTYFDNNEGGIEKKGDGRNFLNYPSFYVNPKNQKKADPSMIFSQFEIFLNHLSKNNNDIYIVYPVPELGFNLTNKVLKNNKFNFQEKIIKANNNIKLTTSYEIYKKRNKKILEFLDNLNIKNVKKIRTDEIFCNKKYYNRCIAVQDNKLLYYDYDHLSIDGSEILTKNILDIIVKN